MTTEKKDVTEREFDKLYNSDDKKRKIDRKEITEKQLKRKLSSAYDYAEDTILNNNEKLLNLRENVESYDVNAVLELNQTIKQLKMIQCEIKEEYKFLFDENLV